jgi:type I restriction enzyme S subunit
MISGRRIGGCRRVGESAQGRKGEWALPDGWVWTTLGEVCLHPQYGWTTKAVEEGELHLLRTTDITSGKIDWKSVPFCREEPDDVGKYLLQDGDIVISRAGSVGYSYLVKKPERAVFASYLIRFKPLIDKHYTAYFLQSPSYWESVYEERLGIAVPNINATKLKGFAFPLAPLPEQRRIVAEIETQFTRLDAAVAALERAQANIRRYRAAVLKAACEGRLVPTEAELARVGAHRDAPLPYEPADQLLARILAERRARWEAEHPGKRYQEPTPPDTENLPELTEGWVWASLEILASDRRHSISSGPFGSALGTKDYRESGVPVIRGQNVADGQLILDSWVYVSEEKAAQLERSVARPGDLVVVAVGSSGRPAIVPPSLPKAILSQNCNKITPDTNLIFPKYLVFAMQIGIIQEQLDQKTTDTVRKFLSLTNLRKTLIPLPPFAEQRRIVAEVERRLSVVAALEASVGAALVRAGRLRQAVLKQAFEGRLVPQDPDDEPASVLLERIRAERAQRGRERSDRKAQPKQMELF